MSTVESVPSSLKQLRACLLCSLVKSRGQFESDGCDNCESVLHLKDRQDNINDCTSASFSGLIASCKPSDSWVARWQHIGNLSMGVYAVSVRGRLPKAVVRDLKDEGIPYRSRDRGKGT